MAGFVCKGMGKMNIVVFGVSLAAAVAANAAETALVRVKWSEFVTTDKVERVMANAYVTAKPLGDAQAIPLHDFPVQKFLKEVSP